MAHVLPDVLSTGLRIVFCGTAAGTASARRGAYYAGPGNAFWRTIHEVGLTPCRLEPEAFRRVVEFGIGLTDLVKTVHGPDSALDERDFDRDGLRAKTLASRPRFLAFTSKRAAEAYLGYPVDYGLLEERIGETALFVLPSPSGAARRWFDIRPWRDLERRARRSAAR